MSLAGIVVTAVLAFAGSNTVAALVKAYFDRRRITEQARTSNVPAAGVLSETALALLEPLHSQVIDLRTQLVDAHTQIRELQERLAHYEHL